MSTLCKVSLFLAEKDCKSKKPFSEKKHDINFCCKVLYPFYQGLVLKFQFF